MTNPAAGMPCPVCRVPLVMSDRQGVEIDYCPQCRGVWLDRGELDKIVERSGREAQQQATPAYAPPPQPGYGQPQHGYPQPQHGYPQPQHGGYSHGKRRKSFLEELFD
ncbi:zf-TFIIB domain-containing protein [Alsobacter sp. SYSU M60028]|uniref:Zf-TFIIB domain-containing protein n=1 Tax=Alsobacter ponti TaxID=2962936 RepID=A0ABT1LA06_9HYPH|nr:zf-TFIIB domain-containing protein [Alsobacter ponti]MCP8938317.1 zf-TFIIB domain-containing protein [Alsobacter ponti]